jgi:hypothetical protein
MELPFNLDLDHIGGLIVIYGVNCLGAILIALAGWWISSLAERMALNGLLSSSHMDRTVAAFLSSLVRYALLAVTLVLILQVVGIQATSLVAVIGASSLAIGLALQGTLSNMAAGVMLLIFRPFKLGDSIEVAGKSGTVQNLNPHQELPQIRSTGAEEQRRRLQHHRRGGRVHGRGLDDDRRREQPAHRIDATCPRRHHRAADAAGRAHRFCRMS